MKLEAFVVPGGGQFAAYCPVCGWDQPQPSKTQPKALAELRAHLFDKGCF